MPLRSLLISGSPGRAKSGEYPAWVTTTNSVEQWANALQSDWIGRHSPTNQEVAEYDLVVANGNPTRIPELLKLAEARPAGQKWVVLIEGDALDYLEPSKEFLRLIESADLIATINKQSEQYFAALSSTPCATIGVPYPLEFVRTFYTEPKNRRKAVIVCPRQDKRPSIMVADSLGVPVSVYFPRFSLKAKNLPEVLRHRTTQKDLYAMLHAAEHPNHEASLQRPLRTFWKEAGAVRLWVNLDPRFTWGRLVLDAAALGVPIITTASTGHGPELFPQTTVPDVFSVEQSKEIGRRLLDDDAFYQEVVDHAIKGVEQYRGEASAARLLAAVGL